MRLPRFVAVAFIATATAIAVGGAVAVPANAVPARKVTSITLTTTLTSATTTLQTQPGGHTYGWNNLVGTTVWAGQDASVSFLGDVNYTGGSGPFNGYVTVTRKDGVVLAFRVSGNALAVPDAPGTTGALFAGSLDVIQGTGPFRRARGIGTMVGARDSALGSAVQLAFRLSILKR